jgi:site-specific DNA-methyltransferase (adenine-specific)
VDGVVLTTSPIKELLNQAKELSNSLTEERSLDLETIRDGGNGQAIRPWRSIHLPPDLPIHKMMSRVGAFPPALARYLIGLYSVPKNVILDPFCGKGTTLLEAAISGRRAVGGDISPEAVVCARAKTVPITTPEVAHYIQNLPEPIEDCSDVPSSVSLFYHKDTLRQLLSIRNRLILDMQDEKKNQIATFLCGVLLGLLHGHSALSLSLPCNQVFAMSPTYVRRFVRDHKLRRPKRDVANCLLLRSLDFLPFPQTMSPVKVVEAPADQCHTYMKQLNLKAHLVITSPPYLNRQTYIKDAWLRLWFLGRDPREVSKPSLETGSVTRFVNGMVSVIESISRSVHKLGTVILVCGRANVDIDGRPYPVRISDLCLLANSQVATRWQLKPDRLIIDRKLMKRGSYFAVHHGKSMDENGFYGRRFGEDEILIFKKP